MKMKLAAILFAEIVVFLIAVAVFIHL